MTRFPTLRTISRRKRDRVSQQDILPSSVRLRQQLAQEKEHTASVSPPGTAGGDFTDIQEAINYVNEIGGGTVFLRSGTYTIDSDIILYDNVSLIGADKDTCILEFNESTSNQIVINSVGRLSIENLFIRNNKHASGAIYIVDSTTGLVIENIKFRSNTIDIYTYKDSSSTRKFRVSYCESEKSGSFAYLDDNTSDCVFEHNRIDETTDYVFEASSNVGRGLFYNNTCWNIEKAMFYGKLQFVRIIGCTTNFTSSSLTTYALDFTSGSQNIEIEGCHFSDGGGDGLQITSSSLVLISSTNIAASGSGHGIFLDTSDACKFTACEVNATTGSAIDGARVTTGDDNIFVGCSLKGNSGYGVNITDAGSDRTIVVGCRLTGGSGASNDTGTGSVLANNT